MGWSCGATAGEIARLHLSLRRDDASLLLFHSTRWLATSFPKPWSQYQTPMQYQRLMTLNPALRRMAWIGNVIYVFLEGIESKNRSNRDLNPWTLTS